MYHRSLFPRAKLFGHTYDNPIDVDNGFKFSLDIPTKWHMNMENLDDEVKGAISTMHRTEGPRVQVTPSSKRSRGNYGS